MEELQGQERERGYTVRLSKRFGAWRGVLVDDRLNAVRFENTEELWRLLSRTEEDFATEVEQLRRAVVTDYLTGALNRRGVEALALDGAHWRYPSALFIDLDNFKQINDTLGHVQGDEVLRQTAEAIRASVRHGDVVGRMGGDEFVVLFCERLTAEQMRRKADEIRAAVAKLGATVSIGGANGPELDYRGLLALADRALYEAKADGKNTFVLLDRMP